VTTSSKKTWFVSDYYLQQTECTVAQYAVFANATLVPNSASQKIFSAAEREAKYNWYPAGATADAEGYNCLLFVDYSTSLQYLNNLWVANTGMATRPMLKVSWYGSLAYCQWIGGSLPTEAEWEFAARRTRNGGNTCYNNNTYAGTNLAVTTSSPGAQDYFWFGDINMLPIGNTTSTQPVATKLPNVIDLYDMSGNVWEWCSSWSGTLAYGADPAGTTSGTYRVARGGCWGTTPDYMAITMRGNSQPEGPRADMGFRPKVQ
jgi:formylglycine-generating enzyme required for sulfatase activity